jgi:nicotinate-nucleotide adenylyltransferase
MIKKGIFGGTFDPIHNGHLSIAYEALNYLELDKILFMPSGNPPHKLKRDKADSSIRYELIEMAIRSEKHFEVSSFEIQRSELSYTYKTVEYFKMLEPETLWYFITGVDCLMELDTWKNPARIFNCCKLVVFNRPGFNMKDILREKEKNEDVYGKEIIFIDLPLLDISSREIKKKIKEGKRADYLMPQGVYNTIIELGLYK